MTFETIRKGWHRKDLGNGTYRHVIKTGCKCWRIVENGDRKTYPGIAKNNRWIGHRETVKEALAVS